MFSFVQTGVRCGLTWLPFPGVFPAARTPVRLTVYIPRRRISRGLIDHCRPSLLIAPRLNLPGRTPPT